MQKLIPVVLLAAGVTAPAAAQQSVRSNGFIDVRYATHTSLTLYGGYDLGGPLLLVGMVQNPRTEYREVVAGMARPVGGGRASATIAMAGAYASDGWYAQVYVMPSVRLGPVSVRGLLLAYEALEERGARQFYVNPMSVLAPVAPRIHLGASYVLAVQAGTRSRHSAGPTLQLSTAAWTATVSTLVGIGATTNELRAGINARL